MDRKNLMRLNWFFQFLRTGLKETTKTELLEMLLQASDYFERTPIRNAAQLKFSLIDEHCTEEDIEEMKSNLLVYQKKLSSLIETITKNFDPYNQFIGNGKELSEKSKLADFGLLIGIPMTGNVIIKIRNKPTIKRDPKSIDKWSVSWGQRNIEQLLAEVLFEPGNAEDAFVFSFLESLNQARLASIKKCPECGAWFVQAGKRARIYCSDRCRAKKGNREKRGMLIESGGSEYEDELKKGKERARKSYVEKVRRKTGNKNIIIAKNKRKEVKNGDTN